MYKVGMLQYEPKLFQVKENLSTLAQMLTGVKADLVVLPELAATGYLFNTKEELMKVAEDANTGITAQLFSHLAKENDCSYVVGFPEYTKDHIYNSCSLFNPDGTIYTYRKNHLFFEEKLLFTPGDSGFVIAPAKGDVRVGLMICFDWYFPESARTLALKGAQIIAHPSNLVLPWCQKAMTTRALENRVFAITANRTGTEVNREKELYFTGMSQIVNTKGEVLTAMGKSEEDVFFVDINPNDALNKQITEHNDALKDRRPEMYKS